MPSSSGSSGTRRMTCFTLLDEGKMVLSSPGNTFLMTQSDIPSGTLHFLFNVHWGYILLIIFVVKNFVLKFQCVLHVLKYI